MKTLYISDLDGTLLNRCAELTPFAKETINRFVSNGGYFTVATARPPVTVMHILDGVRLSAPAVLLNGVSIYDTRAMKTIKTEALSPLCLSFLFKTLAEHKITGFVYTQEDGGMTYHYERPGTKRTKELRDERAEKYGIVYTPVNAFADLFDREIIYFSACDQPALLTPAYNRLKTDERLRVEFYKDIYHADFWQLDVCAAAASKYNATLYLKETCGFDRIVSFGDNLNDLPLFAASDECYAVSNAIDELKERATAVIESNDCDGVAKWLGGLSFA